MRSQCHRNTQNFNRERPNKCESKSKPTSHNSRLRSSSMFKNQKFSSSKNRLLNNSHLKAEIFASFFWLIIATGVMIVIFRMLLKISLVSTCTAQENVKNQINVYSNTKLWELMRKSLSSCETMRNSWSKNCRKTVRPTLATTLRITCETRRCRVRKTLCEVLCCRQVCWSRQRRLVGSRRRCRLMADPKVSIQRWCSSGWWSRGQCSQQASKLFPSCLPISNS